MLRRTTLVLALLAIAGAPGGRRTGRAARRSPVAAPGSSSSLDVSVALKALGGDVVQELNRVRAARGLRPLRPTAALAASARGTRRRWARAASSTTTPPTARRSGAGSSASTATVASAAGRSARTSSGSRRRRSRRSPSCAPGWDRRATGRTCSRASWRDVGVGAVSLPSAPGVYGGSPVTIVTVDFGKRRR